MSEPEPPPSEAPPSAPLAAPSQVPAPPTAGVVRFALGFYGVATLFAVGYALFSGTSKTLFGTQSPPASSVLAATLVGLGIVGLCHLGLRLLPAVRGAADALTEVLGPLTYGQVALLALVSGFAEELLFRGALWPHLGLLGTTLLFGLVHVVPKRALLGYPLFATGAGLILGGIRHGSGSVLPAMLCHAIVNALNLASLERRRRRAVASRAAPRA